MMWSCTGGDIGLKISSRRSRNTGQSQCGMTKPTPVMRLAGISHCDDRHKMNVDEPWMTSESIVLVKTRWSPNPTTPHRRKTSVEKPIRSYGVIDFPYFAQIPYIRHLVRY